MLHLRDKKANTGCVIPAEMKLQQCQMGHQNQDQISLLLVMQMETMHCIRQEAANSLQWDMFKYSATSIQHSFGQIQHSSGFLHQLVRNW